MANPNHQEPPAADTLSLGFHPQSAPSSPSDLLKDLLGLRLEEGKDGAESRSEASEEKVDANGDQKKKRRGMRGRPIHPRRPPEPDCPHYLKTRSCAFGSKCRFNHPNLQKKDQVQSEDSSESVQATEDDDSKGIGEDKCFEKVGNLRCKYLDTPGGCKYGSACRYKHNEDKKETEQVELNFLGLPMRPDMKECPFYMKNGSCKFSINCRYHHPDPSASVGTPGSGMRSGHSGAGSSYVDISRAPQIPAPLHTPLIPPTSLFPYMQEPSYAPPIPPGHQPLPQLNPGWVGYQHPIDVPFGRPESSGSYIPIYPMQRPPSSSNSSKYQQQIHNQSNKQIHNQSNKFPHRPGQPDCPHYLKSGNCKFKSACKFNHPQDRLPSACLLNPKGLPLRPGKSMCENYSRFGICKFGPSCKYDHPMDPSPEALAQ